MRRTIVLGGVLLVGLLARPTQAQVAVAGGFDDPFFLYYSFFIPQQAYLASIPRTEDTLRQMAVQRQLQAVTDRAGLIDPASGLANYDPFAAYTDRVSPVPVPLSRSGPVNTNLNGLGPAGYYNRVANYFPGQRSGIANSSIPMPNYGPRLTPFGTVQRSMGGRSRLGGLGGGGFGGFGGMGGLGGMGLGGMR
ncbi:MAG: hypothetical protein KatS3mg108_0573 [Isosphaeraceae bacterium]|jgi:hypothetical protein|nr:MAG: hypothetical protein KatS3mg108_0573 [Isosphaeraceae bacterium]